MTTPPPFLTITTPLGDDAFTLTGLRGEEAVSQPFRFELDLATGRGDISFGAMVGESVTVKIAQTADTTRYINGIVSRFVLVRMTDTHGGLYRAVLVPRLWRLQLNADCRIFQNQTVPDIVKAVLGEQGVDAIRDALTASYTARDYCVQYRESGFAFISRLMEEEGIFYFFEHEDGKHTMVLADDLDARADCPGINTLQFIPPPDSQRIFEEHITDVSYEEEVASDGVALGDYNFTTPSTDIGAQSGATDEATRIYDYPGRYQDKGTGETQTRLRLEALQAPARRIRGSSRCRTLIAGYKATLQDHPRSDLNAAYVLLSVALEATPDSYTNSFTGMPASVAYRPPRTTPKPVIAGAQTAVVVGQSGEEIFTDEHGRIKVQFHWDRLGKSDENSSCWIRVAQGWAGKAWGAWFLPRVGMEVVVGFLNGDPDRPLVTGAVYNADQTLPYTLPDKMTTSTILSRSSKQGTAGNELRFDDTKDSEEFYLHAQKDMTIEVENARTATIKEGDETLTVSKGNRRVAVETGTETHTVKGTRSLTVEGAETHTSKDKFTHDVTGDYTLKVGGNMTIEVTGSLTIKGSSDATVKAGTGMTIQAGTSLTAKAGTDFTAEGGTNFTAKAGLGMTVQGGTTVDVKGSAMGTVDGGGMLTLKGGLVKIN